MKEEIKSLAMELIEVIGDDEFTGALSHALAKMRDKLQLHGFTREEAIQLIAQLGRNAKG